MQFELNVFVEKTFQTQIITHRKAFLYILNYVYRGSSKFSYHIR